MHQRKLIRQVVAATLVNATAATDRVFTTRMNPVRMPELPALCIYSEDERVTPDSQKTFPRELERRLEIVVEGYVGLTDQIDDELDDLAEQVEKLMHADPTFSAQTGEAVVGDSVMTSTIFTFKDEGNRPFGAFRMVYEFTYHQLAPLEADMATLDTFDKLGVKYSLGNAQAPADQAQDLETGIHQP